jgi:hypothetical protein
MIHQKLAEFLFVPKSYFVPHLSRTSDFVNGADIFWDYPPITQINGDYAASSKLGNKKRKRKKKKE